MTASFRATETLALRSPLRFASLTPQALSADHFDDEPEILEEPADLVLNIPLDLDEQSSADKKGFDRVGHPAQRAGSTPLLRRRLRDVVCFAHAGQKRCRRARDMHRIVVVGGGVAGIVTATHLSRRLTRSKLADILLVDHNLAHVWKPMLHTFAAGTANYTNENISFISHAKRNHFRYWPGELSGLRLRG
jgi:FAD-NAD(P)-binding protein